MPSETLSVLGIDAAWTDHEPSGIALLQLRRGRWRCLRVAPSDAAFCEGTEWPGRIRGAPVDVPRLLAVCRDLLGGGQPTVVSVDMPLSRGLIVDRRPADNFVSRRFGHCKCAAYSPNRERPGATSRRLYRGFVGHGYSLATRSSSKLPALLEVYPHVALLGLTNRSERLPYKVSKRDTYWPGLPRPRSKRRLVAEWSGIMAALRGHLGPVPMPMPTRVEERSFSYLKRFEDALDALVCAWVGTLFLQGTATALGDDSSAIWLPSSSLAFAKGPHAT